VDAGGDLGEFAGACGSSPVYADDFVAASAPGAGYTTLDGTWTRAAGSYTGTDHGAADGARAYALIAGDYADFDITLEGHSIAGDGFGLVFATTGIGDGYAVLVHPKEYQGLYLKQLVPNQGDVGIGSTTLPTLPADSPFTLRVQYVSGKVTATLSGAALASTLTLSGNVPAGAPTHGRLGLIESTTSAGQGVVFTDLDVAKAACYAAASDAGSAHDGGDAASAPLPEGYASNGLGSQWTLIFDDEFDHIFGTPTGLDPSKWATGWGSTDNGSLTWPVPGDDSDPNAWAICDPAMNSVAGGTVGGRTGSFLWQSVAYKPQTDVDPSNYAQGSVQTNPTWGNAAAGASPGAQFTPEIYAEASIWTSTDSNGQMVNWPSFWFASQNDPTTGELDVLEGIDGVPNYHWHNGSNGPGGSASGNWSGWHTYGAHWTSSAVTWYYDGVEVGTVSAGILANAMFIVLSMGYPSYSSANNSTPTTNAPGPGGFGIVPQQITDYVRVWSP
jgi:hypothetical protein